MRTMMGVKKENGEVIYKAKAMTDNEISYLRWTLKYKEKRKIVGQIASYPNWIIVE